MKKSTKTIVTAGFAMFSMFFGSGNLVFPLDMGRMVLDQSFFTVLGLIISGVIVPFLGLIGVILYSGNRKNFFSCIGKTPAFLLTVAMLAMMGPIGVIPRCIIVAFGGTKLFLPNLSFELFNAVFCLLTIFLVWKHDRIVPVIGRVLTPFLLGSIITIIIVGFIKGPAMEPSTFTSLEAFSIGLNQGYQTMDLLAAFFFSATTVSYIRAHLRSDDKPNKLVKLSLSASLIGASLLATIYISFVFLSAKFSPHLADVKPEQLLVGIAGSTLGPLAIPIASISIILACLTTATILVMLCSDFLHEEVFKEKMNLQVMILAVVFVSYFVALVGFDRLKIWIHSVLQIAYPALILLTIFNIIHKIWGLNWSKWAFWVTFLVCTVFYTIY